MKVLRYSLLMAEFTANSQAEHKYVHFIAMYNKLINLHLLAVVWVGMMGGESTCDSSKWFNHHDHDDDMHKSAMSQHRHHETEQQHIMQK